MGRIIADVVGYIRVSSEDQAEHGVSLDAQRIKVDAHSKALGLNLIRIVEDPGASAKSLDRAGMREVLALLEGGVDGVIVAKLDRLTRSVRDLYELFELYFAIEGGPILISASESIETRTATGRMVLGVMMVVSQWERETIVERTGQAMDHKREKGERLGTMPYGWMLGRDLKTLIPCPSELVTLSFMASLRSRGMKLRAIAEHLDDMGHATRTGRPWAVSSISKLLGEYAKPSPEDRPDEIEA